MPLQGQLGRPCAVPITPEPRAGGSCEDGGFVVEQKYNMKTEGMWDGHGVVSRG